MEIYITPERILELTFGKNVPQIPKTVYIFFYKSLVKKIEDNFEFKKIKFTRGDFYIEKNKKFGIITNFGVGESGALMLAEELSALGVERVIAVGAVGSLSNNLKIGELVLIESAFSQSNIGKIYGYTKSEVFTSKKQNKKIEEIFKQSKIDITQVKTFSVPTIYRETYKDIKKAVKNNVSVIEMETFSLALIFSLNGIHFSAVGCVSDVLKDEKWSFDNDFKIVFNVLKHAFLKTQKELEFNNE